MLIFDFSICSFSCIYISRLLLLLLLLLHSLLCCLHYYSPTPCLTHNTTQTTHRCYSSVDNFNVVCTSIHDDGDVLRMSPTELIVGVMASDDRNSLDVTRMSGTTALVCWRDGSNAEKAGTCTLLTTTDIHGATNVVTKRSNGNI